MCFFKKKKAAKEAAKKAEAKKAETVAKEEPKKAEPKKAEPKVMPEPAVEEKKAVDFRTYHVAKREDGKWAVKYAGGQKAIKLFATQKEAVEYTKTMAANQDGAMLVHNSKGANKGKIKKK